MILARTNLKEMPERCGECVYSYMQLSRNYGWCASSKIRIKLDDPRPDWCPLVEATQDELDTKEQDND